MLRKFFTTALVSLLLAAVMSLDCFSARVSGQQQKIPQDPIQFIDASTGKLIPELLLIPRYSSFKGVSTMLGEGPQSGSYHDYLARPFVYRSRTPFILKRPKTVGLPLLPFVFIGKGRSIWGVFVFAPGYRPQGFTDLWSRGPERKIPLTPISSDEELRRWEEVFSPLEGGAARIAQDCSFWQLPESCALEIHFTKKERELVRSFLRQAGKGTQ